MTEIPTAPADGFRAACSADPSDGESWLELATAYFFDGNPKAAEDALREGLAANPASAYLQFNLGNLLLAVGRVDEAEVAFERVCTLDAAHQDAWLQLGSLRYARAAHRAAAAAFRRAAELGGEQELHALRLAGFALADGGLPEDAAVLLADVAGRATDAAHDLPLLSQLLYSRLELCDWHDFSDLAKRCCDLLAEGAVPIEPFTFLLLEQIDSATQLTLSENFCRPLMATKPLPAPKPREGSCARRLRLGYLGDIFQDHATARLSVGVIEHHDRTAFEVHAFSYGTADDGAMRRRLVNSCDQFHDVGGLDARHLAEFIHAREIDILVDLNGWTGNTLTSALAWRPAPVQVNWLGYPATIGSRRLADYLIGDPVVTPLDRAAHYAETLALMPNCYQPNDRKRRIGATATRAVVGLPVRGFVFCCFNRFLKISPDMFRVWCEILRRVPDSLLWLLHGHPTAEDRLRASAAEHGVAAERLVFASHLPQEEHLARLALADLVLDTLPYGAHTTASDALWVGVPVLTQLGETFSGRVAASLLHACGMSELIASTRADYADRAVALATDAVQLEALRARLAVNRLNTPLFDTAGFTSDYEALLGAIWRHHECGALGPVTLRS